MDGYDDDAWDEIGPGSREQVDQPPQRPAAPSFTDLATVPRWTTADDVRYARKASSLDRLRDDIDAGVLYPHDAVQLFNPLTQDLAAMDRQKATFDQHQQQTANQAVMQASAAKRGMATIDRQHDADAFLGTLRDYYNPVTGATALFFPTGDGKWAQATTVPPGEVAAAGEESAAGDDEPEGGAEPATPSASGESGGLTAEQKAAGGKTLGDGTTSYPPAAGPGGSRADDERMNALPSTLRAAAAGSMTIQNGQSIDRYQDGQLVGTNRQPQAKGDGPGTAFGLPPAKLAEIEHLANAQSMHMRPGHSRDALKSHLIQRYTTAAIVEQGRMKQQQAVAAQKARQVEDVEWKDLRTASLDAIKKDHDAALKAGDDSPHGTPAQRLKAADDLAHEQWAARHPEHPRSKEWLKRQSESGKPGGAIEAEAKINAPGALNVLRVAERAGFTKKDALDTFNAKLKEVKADEGNADKVPDPGDPGRLVGGPWNKLPEPVQRAEAVRRFAVDLETMTGKKLLPEPAPPAKPQGPTPQQKAQIDQQRQKLTLGPPKPGEASKLNVERTGAAQVLNASQQPGIPAGAMPTTGRVQVIQNEGRNIRKLLGLE